MLQSLTLKLFRYNVRDMSVNETYLSELHSRTSRDSQMSLSKFSDSTKKDSETAIAVISDPTGGIVEVSDEYMPSLGMPEEILNEFRKTRAELDIDDDIERHNTAASQVKLEERYKKHLKENEDATKKVTELSERVQNGEDITLVCFEKQPKWCHRHILKEQVKQLLEDRKENNKNSAHSG